MLTLPSCPATFLDVLNVAEVKSLTGRRRSQQVQLGDWPSARLRGHAEGDPDLIAYLNHLRE